MASPGEKHFKAMSHTLRYLCDNVYVGLKYYHDVSNAPMADLLRNADIEAALTLAAAQDVTLC